MISKSRQPLAVLLLLICYSFVAVAGGVVAKSRGTKHRNVRPRASTGELEKKFEVGQAIDLKLLQCSGEITLPGTGIVADALEINQGIVALSSGGTAVKRGEVIAYAQSKYFLDSNVAFIFDRSGKPASSDDWKPPIIASLNLIQDRNNLRHFTLKSIPFGDLPIISSTFTCVSAAATAK